MLVQLNVILFQVKHRVIVDIYNLEHQSRVKQILILGISGKLEEEHLMVHRGEPHPEHTIF